MATVLDPSPRATLRQPGTIQHLLAAIQDLKRLGLDHLELATAEAQRAARGFVSIVCAAIVVAVLAFTAWNAMVAAVVLMLVDQEIGWPVALGAAAVLHLAAAGAVVFWMRSRVPELVFSATVRQLRADAGEKP
ncbi:MAG: phage holin family protein [Betaproteobacteria bacterium]